VGRRAYFRRFSVDWRFRLATKLQLAEVPQIDDRLGDGLQTVVQFANALETQQSPLELVFPAEDPLNGVEPLLENDGIKKLLGPGLWCLSCADIFVDVESRPPIEDGLAVAPAVVHTVQAHDHPSQAKTNGLGDRFELRQCFSKHGGLITVAKCRHQWNDHIAVSITEDDRLVAFDLLVATEANVVATLLRCGSGAITVDDADVKMSGLLQG